ncbi:excinuclease ABC subunit B [Salipiger sp.]|uniref:excinuclease ABC subunit B n=1 Tax=Salipiger sp. TaxID=2078585 RepID=UPI003A96DDF0
MRRFVFLSLLLLAACGTPVERCLSGAAAPYRDALKERERIARDLSRGFVFQTKFEQVTRFTGCRQSRHDKSAFPCWRTDMQPVTRRIPVDRDALRQRDAQLARDLPALRRAASEDQQQCRAAFPPEESVPG